MKIVNIVTSVIAVICLSACTSIYDKHVQWQPVKPEVFPVVTAVGYAPISLQKSTHETQRMLMAIKASKLAAYAELAEQVYGQQVASNMTMGDLLIENHQLKASVHGVIRGAKVVKSYPVGDTYATELSIDFKDVYDIYIASARKQEIKDVTYY
ncbi:flagellar biosynthesis protein FlgP [Thalassotalea euphylliae]|uniref:Flagellar biosynthesis protein FlgP n=1 Tax=Thalassotalea euphylliae TaxID=1655234 RepID=A0A3E0TTP9_9GAMM|nr:LPP20 family lipoprotein [Thalassotalea euphylliae]REL27849.1 flagellar biosynthesis protein FlgP [Thalassotalea euphylliae]